MTQRLLLPLTVALAIYCNTANASSCDAYMAKYDQLINGDPWENVIKLFGLPTHIEGGTNGDSLIYTYDLKGCRLKFVSGTRGTLASKQQAPLNQLSVTAPGAIAPGQMLWIDKVMSPEEMRITGITTLTPEQRKALDLWLFQYTGRLIHRSQPAGGTEALERSYLGVGGGHWIKSKGNGGTLIVLEDGSVWEINSLDRIDTALWLPITDVTVLNASSPIGEYRYTLVNKEDGEQALAKYLGKE